VSVSLRKQLEDLMEEKGLSLTAISRALGYSTGAMSSWAAGTYTGNVAKIDDAVKGLLEREREKKQTPKKAYAFVMTSIAKKVFEVARICHLDNELGICYGDAGLGKTDAAKEYAKRNSDTILVEADLGFTAKVLFSYLHKNAGLSGLGSINDMKEEIIAKLKGSGRLIIIDEAEHLPYRALELLRRVYDKAGVGIMLVGMPRLRENLKGRKGEYTQLYSRVGVAGRLELLRATDTEEIVKVTVPSINGLWKAYHEASSQNTRRLSKLLARSVRIATINDMPLNPDIIREAAKTLIV